MKQSSVALPVPSSSITEHFVRSSGPGGQNVNKVSSAVELRFDLNLSGLADDVQGRLAKLAGHKLAASHIVVIHAHEYRTQLKNREAARERLADLIKRAARKPRARRPTKPTPVRREQRLESKHRRSALKRRRSARGDDE